MAIAKPARTNFVLDCQSNCTSVDWKHGSRPENTPVVQCDWTSRTKFVWAAFEQSSPSIPIAIDFTPAQRDLERELMGRHHEIDFFWDLKTPTHRGSVKNSASAHARSCRRKAPSVTQLRSPAPRRYLSMSSTASVLSQDIRTLSWSQWERPELHRVADSQLGDRATTCERDAHLHPEDLRGVMAIHIAKNACTAHRKTPVHGSIPLEATYKVPRFPATKAALALRCCSA